MNTQEIILDETYDFSFDANEFRCPGLTQEEIIEMYRDGRVFSQWIERWMERTFPELTRISGCKKYDFINSNDENIKYEAKTFTSASGLSYAPSGQTGVGRKIDEPIARERASNLIYTIVSNVNFPNIKIKFLHGNDLMKKETELMKRKDGKIKCKISLTHHDAFFA